MTCDCGQRHWGLLGAAGLLLSHQSQVLLQQRATWSHEGGTWSVPGGALDTGESPRQGALREAAEEAGVHPDQVDPWAAVQVDHGPWAYTTVLAGTGERLPARPADAESTSLAWVPEQDVAGMPLHHAFAAAWPTLRWLRAGGPMTLVVDAANVVGSRPDGWWRDRRGATTRMLEALDGRLATQGLTYTPAGMPVPPGEQQVQVIWWPRTVVVVEGQARALSRQYLSTRLSVVAAPRDGDSTIVSTTLAEPDSRGILVATSDRELRRRVAVAGATSVGAGWLRDQLDSDTRPHRATPADPGS